MIVPKIDIAKAAVRTRSAYPGEFGKVTHGREKIVLGDVVGLTQFGVNLTRLKPGAASAHRHWHETEDEFVYILEGEPTLVTDKGEMPLRPGMCAGFPAAGVAHHLVNRTNRDVTYLEIGDRTPGDEGSYPNDDIQAVLGPDGKWIFAHKDGRPY